MIKFLFITLSFLNVYSNGELTGTVVDNDGEPIINVLVYIKNTNTSTYTDSLGNFCLNIVEANKNDTLGFSALGYESKELPILSSQMQKIILKEKDIQIKEISVRSDRYARIGGYAAQKIDIKPFEVYTSPTAFGDILGVLKLSPGAQSPGNDGRLYVRGGTSEESQVFVDNMMIYNPYTLSQKNVPVRSRFSPNMYEGTSLLAGGYGSDYGQALSGILSLNTKNTLEPRLDISVTSTGISSALIKSKRKSQFYSALTYTNMYPYGQLFEDVYDWNEYYTNITGDFFAIFNPTKKINIKTQLSFSKSSVDYSYDKIDNIVINNDFSETYAWGQATLNYRLNSNVNIFYGSNFVINSFNGTDLNFKGDSVETDVCFNHNKMSLEIDNGNISYKIGVEGLYTLFDESYYLDTIFNSDIDNWLLSNFYEVEFTNNYKTNIIIGARVEYSSVLDRYNIAPRLYVSHRFNENSIISFTAGKYFQNPDNVYLKYNKNINWLNSNNVTLSYVYAKKQGKLQVDGYYKKYSNLITYKEENLYYTNISNNGNGYAYGLDIFWKGRMKLLEYWFSYSYINSERLYKSYENERTPDLISDNLLKIDLKYWLGFAKSLLGVGYFFDTGHFSDVRIMNEDILMKTPERNSLTLNISFLPFRNTIIHFSCQNVLGANNIYGYTGSYLTDSYKEVTTPSKRFYYLGLFLTFSDSKTINQLNKL
jgi:hypothetical protein